jgi:hypothetical protein
VPAPVFAGGELAAKLPDRPEALGEDLMVVDRLEVHLACEHEVIVVELVVSVERALDHEADRVLHEPWRKMRVLDDEELVRALEKLVDGRAHRPLDELDEILRVDPKARAEEEAASSSLVVRG